MQSWPLRDCSHSAANDFLSGLCAGRGGGGAGARTRRKWLLLAKARSCYAVHSSMGRPSAICFRMYACIALVVTVFYFKFEPLQRGFQQLAPYARHLRVGHLFLPSPV